MIFENINNNSLMQNHYWDIPSVLLPTINPGAIIYGDHIYYLAVNDMSEYMAACVKHENPSLIVTGDWS